MTVLHDRKQYQSCHIQISDMMGRLPAIQVNQQYYVFLAVVSDQQRTHQIAEQLSQKGDQVIVTPIPKGYALWVLEADATYVPKRYHPPRVKDDSPAQPPPSKPVSSQSSSPGSVIPSQRNGNPAPKVPVPQNDVAQQIPFPVLTEATAVKERQIKVPDLDGTLAALLYKGEYYSFFRVVGDTTELITIAKKLNQRGDRAVITLESQRYSIWIVEPEATVVTSTPQ